MVELETIQQSANDRILAKTVSLIPGLHPHADITDDTTIANYFRIQLKTGNITLDTTTSLNLSICDMISLPVEITQLTNLQTLDLGHNRLTIVPDSLGQLTNLRKLVLSDNQLTIVPDSLGRLTNLRKLYLSGNQLTIVSDYLEQLTGLQTLYLSGNELTSVPNSIGRLTSLRKLYLSHNQLTIVPDSLGRLTSLVALDLSGNQLTSVPDSLGQLTGLQTLNLSRNQLPLSTINYKQRVLDSLMQITSEESCTICRDHLIDRRLPCEHEWCSRCILRIATINGLCPYCRVSFCPQGMTELELENYVWNND